MKLFLALCLVLLSAISQAAWQLDRENSVVSLVSTKKGNLAEIFVIKQLSGGIDESGNAQVDLQLDSIDTKVPIRDERMREHLFETIKFPKAILTAQIEPGVFDTLKAGSSSALSLNASLELHGQKKTLSLDVLVTRISETALLAVSRTPVLVHAGDYELVAGIEKLREMAKLPTISTTVPVSFVLIFQQ